MRRVIVVGASSGIGLEVCRQLVSRGDQVVGLARRCEPIQSVGAFPIEHDVRELASVEAAFRSATDRLGGLDAVVYAAGVMARATPDDYDTTADEQMILVNYLGAVAWLNLAALRFSAVGAGSIVGIGSVAGDRGRRGQPVYNSSKAALHTYLESLRNRGLTVATIKPGPVATPMLEGSDFRNPMPVDIAARKIIAKIGRNGEFYLSPVHQALFTVIRHVPSPIFRRLRI